MLVTTKKAFKDEFRKPERVSYHYELVDFLNMIFTLNQPFWSSCQISVLFCVGCLLSIYCTSRSQLNLHKVPTATDHRTVKNMQNLYPKND